MTPTEQRAAARRFVERWQAAEGNEQREANSFWIELFSEVLGVTNPTHVLDFERQAKGKRIDVFHEDAGVLIENKSRGVDLDKRYERGKDEGGDARTVTPFEQAKWYADNLPRSLSPRWVVTCNFDEIRIYDLDEEWPEKAFETILLGELPENCHRLSFLVRKENSRAEREKELSVAAGEVVGKLYDAFSGAYLNIEGDPAEQRSLNVLITRIVFLLYAEDAELLQEHQAFYKYLKNHQVEHMRMALRDLFEVLRTPEGERDPYLRDELKAFPYVNGGLFKDDVIIPQFDENMRYLLLQEASAEFDWKDISPTIFGAVFESTLNPETRRSGGMHYTSIENIHKLTGPLFYDGLKDELKAIEGLKTEKERKFKLNAFRQKIASLKFLDPACGSGNFLTETYLSLRKLENRVLEDLYGGQMVMGEFEPIQVQVGQFYGIEVNDFAVEVAKTALWIAELQMLDQTREILSMWIDPLPLKSNDNIVCANALRIDWNDVLPASEASYVIGNPPFYGSSMCSDSQKQEIVDLYTQHGSEKVKLANSLDYVSGWYYKACQMMCENERIRAAFVSTNSITQGEQVYPIWHTLFDRFGIQIDFAWKTFIWDSEASDKAHVHVVIVGFSKEAPAEGKVLFGADGSRAEASNISPYLIDAPSVLVASSAKAICPGHPLMKNGSKPTDGGWYLFTEDEMEAFVAEEPASASFFRPWVGADEFIKNTCRWCLYLGNVSLDDIRDMPNVLGRVEAVRRVRLGTGPNSKGKMASKRPPKPTVQAADRPMTFFCDNVQDEPYLIIPSVSGERRAYVPIGFMSPDVIASNLVATAESATLYDFGIITSQFHMAWMRTVSGRMESRYRYTPQLVYNTFVWPDPAPEQRENIARCAQSVLDAREAHKGDSLAEMYDGISPMPENPSKADQKKYDQREYDDLKAAHAALDAAVEAAYGVNFGGDEEKIVAHLFRLYAEATGGK